MSGIQVALLCKTYRQLKKCNCVIIFLDNKVSKEFTHDLAVLYAKNDQHKRNG